MRKTIFIAGTLVAALAGLAWCHCLPTGHGLAATPQVVIAAMYGISAEDRLPLVRLGFFF